VFQGPQRNPAIHLEIPKPKTPKLNATTPKN
jgi:hypothetical protein